jgi:Family of unknown function (DUF6441)
VRGLKTELRRQVTSAGFGQRLANSWRDKHYPNQKLDAASLSTQRQLQIIRAFDECAVIRSRRGRLLAVPTENAPKKGTDGKRISPSTFPEHRFGPLRFVPRPTPLSLPVVDGSRLVPPQDRGAAGLQAGNGSGAEERTGSAYPEGSPTGSDLVKEMPKADGSRAGLITSPRQTSTSEHHLIEYARPPDSH